MKWVDVKRKSVREKDCVWTKHNGPFIEDRRVFYRQDEENGNKLSETDVSLIAGKTKSLNRQRE
jgi:hypothetical protein